MTIEDLYEQYHLLLYNYINLKLRHAQEAEDVTHVVFLKAMLALDTMRPDANYRSWLYRIATTTCIDALRRRNRVIFVELQPWHHVGGLPDVDRRQEVARTLSHLTSSQQRALQMFYLEGYSMEEIAQVIDLSPNGMKMFLYRAREAFKIHYRVQAREEQAA